MRLALAVVFAATAILMLCIVAAINADSEWRILPLPGGSAIALSGGQVIRLQPINPNFQGSYMPCYRFPVCSLGTVCGLALAALAAGGLRLLIGDAFAEDSLAFRSAPPRRRRRYMAAAGIAAVLAAVVGLHAFSAAHPLRLAPGLVLQAGELIDVSGCMERGLMPLFIPETLLGLLLFMVLACARRPAAGLCPRCDYDLRATPGRCPECGRQAAKPLNLR